MRLLHGPKNMQHQSFHMSSLRWKTSFCDTFRCIFVLFCVEKSGNSEFPLPKAPSLENRNYCVRDTVSGCMPQNHFSVWPQSLPILQTQLDNFTRHMKTVSWAFAVELEKKKRQENIHFPRKQDWTSNDMRQVCSWK